MGAVLSQWTDNNWEVILINEALLRKEVLFLSKLLKLRIHLMCTTDNYKKNITK